MLFNTRNTLVVLTLLTGLVGCGGSDSNDDNGQDNLLPQVNAGSDFSLEENSNGQLNGSATDSDGTIVSYQWQQTAGTTVQLADPSNATTSFTAPEVDTDETLTFQLTATDNDGGQSSDSVNVEVLNVNALPIVDAGENFSVNEGDNATLNGSASDTDGTIVSYQWQQLSGSDVVLQNADTAIANFDAPQVTESTLLSFELTVTDNDGGEASDTIDVEVLHVNQAPEVDAGVNQTVQKNDLVTLTGSATDPDGEIVSYLWQQVAGTEVALTTPAQTSTEFTVSHLSVSETLEFAFTATDNDGAQTSDTVEVFVDVEDVSPSVSAGEEQLIFDPATIYLSGSATANNGGHIVSYQWTQIAGTPVTIDEANKDVASFVLPASIIDEVIIFELVATDNASTQADATTNVVVSSKQKAKDVINQKSIPDLGLYECLRLYSYSDMYIHEITEISCNYDYDYNYPIESFTGIDILFNLRTLDFGNYVLNYQEDADINPLFELRALEKLYLDNIGNIEKLSNLSLLNTLHLYIGEIEDYSPLLTLKRIENANFIGRFESKPIAEYVGQLLTLKSLHLSTIDQDLTPLKNLVNLERFTISFNDISDISPLKNMKSLKELVIIYSNISDISVLSELTQLEDIRLSSNKLTHLANLEKLNKLTNLDLSFNNITGNLSDLGIIASVEEINIRGNNIETITEVGKNWPNLVRLEASENPINIVSGLNGLMQLKYVDLNHAELTELPTLADLPKLSTIDFSYNNIDKVNEIGNLPELIEVYLSANNITGEVKLANLPSLLRATITNNKTHFSIDIENTPNMVKLDLYNNQLTASSFTRLPSSLKNLSIAQNDLKDTDVPDIAHLVNLTTLNLSNNHIKNMPSSTTMASLNKLILDENNIESLSWISAFPSVYKLYLKNNNIVDSSPLLDSVAGDKTGPEGGIVDLTGNNNIPCDEIDTLRETKIVYSECPF